MTNRHSKLKSINTKFWSDPYVRKLPSDSKIIFLWLLTNSDLVGNLAGIYEFNLIKMYEETAIPEERCREIIKQLEKDKKIVIINDYVVLINYLRHQKIMNYSMYKNILSVIDNLPDDVKDGLPDGYKRQLNKLLSAVSTGSAHGVDKVWSIETEEENEDEDRVSFQESKFKNLNYFLKTFKALFPDIHNLGSYHYDLCNSMSSNSNKFTEKKWKTLIQDYIKTLYNKQEIKRIK